MSDPTLWVGRFFYITLNKLWPMAPLQFQPSSDQSLPSLNLSLVPSEIPVLNGFLYQEGHATMNFRLSISKSIKVRLRKRMKAAENVGNLSLVNRFLAILAIIKDKRISE